MRNGVTQSITGSRARLLLTAALLGVAVAGASFAQAPKGGAPQKPAVTVGPRGDATKGGVIYKRNCEICHHSASTAKKIGPGLKGVYKRETFAAGKPVNDETMRTWIEDGGKDMPQFKNTLKPEQIADLIAYIRTL